MTEWTVGGRKRLMPGRQGFPWDSRRIPDGFPHQRRSYVIHRNILLHNWSQNKPGGEELVEAGEKGLKPPDPWLHSTLNVDPRRVKCTSVEAGEKGLKPPDPWLHSTLDVDPHRVKCTSVEAGQKELKPPDPWLY